MQDSGGVLSPPARPVPSPSVPGVPHVSGTGWVSRLVGVQLRRLYAALLWAWLSAAARAGDGNRWKVLYWPSHARVAIDTRLPLARTRNGFPGDGSQVITHTHGPRVLGLLARGRANVDWSEAKRSSSLPQDRSRPFVRQGVGNKSVIAVGTKFFGETTSTRGRWSYGGKRETCSIRRAMRHSRANISGWLVVRLPHHSTRRFSSAASAPEAEPF